MLTKKGGVTALIVFEKTIGKGIFMKRLKHIFIKYNIPDEEAELAAYGIYRFILFVFGVLIALLIGWIFGKGEEISLFLIMFIPLRIYAGGVHLDSLWKCGIVSSAIIILVSIFFRIDMHEHEMIMMLVVVSEGMIHIILAPQDSERKRLYVSEKKRFAKISRIIVYIYLGMASIAILYNWDIVLQILSAAMTVSGLSLVGAFAYNYVYRVKG